MEATTRRRARERRSTRRRWPSLEALLASRLRSAAAGERRRLVLLGLIATIGEPVRPGPPALGSWARERWAENRKAELRRQLDLLKILRPRP